MLRDQWLRDLTPGHVTRSAATRGNTPHQSGYVTSAGRSRNPQIPHPHTRFRSSDIS